MIQCQICLRTTENPHLTMCDNCDQTIKGIHRGNADVILRVCLNLLEIPPQSEFVRIVLDRADCNAGQFRINDPQRLRPGVHPQ